MNKKFDQLIRQKKKKSNFQNDDKEIWQANSFCEATITLIPKPDKDATKKGKLQAHITDEHRCKNP